MLGDRREAGASSVEYGLIVVAIAAVIAAVVFVVGGRVGGLFNDTCDAFAEGDFQTRSDCP